jgi:hypothetical protein
MRTNACIARAMAGQAALSLPDGNAIFTQTWPKWCYHAREIPVKTMGKGIDAMKVDGRCHCGYVSFEAEADPETTTICNCTDCQL